MKVQGRQNKARIGLGRSNHAREGHRRQEKARAGQIISRKAWEGLRRPRKARAGRIMSATAKEGLGIPGKPKKVCGRPWQAGYMPIYLFLSAITFDIFLIKN